MDKNKHSSDFNLKILREICRSWNNIKPRNLIIYGIPRYVINTIINSYRDFLNRLVDNSGSLMFSDEEGQEEIKSIAQEILDDCEKVMIVLDELEPGKHQSIIKDGPLRIIKRILNDGYLSLDKKKHIRDSLLVHLDFTPDQYKKILELDLEKIDKHNRKKAETLHSNQEEEALPENKGYAVDD